MKVEVDLNHWAELHRALGIALGTLEGITMMSFLTDAKDAARESVRRIENIMQEDDVA